MLIECQMFQCSDFQIFQCFNVPMIQCSNVPFVHWYIGPLKHWSVGPLKHWSIIPLDYCTIGPPSWGKYRPNISLSYIAGKYLKSVLRAIFNWSSKFHFLLPAAGLNWNWFYCKSFICSWLCSTSPEIYQKWNWTEENLQIFCLK